MAATRTKELPEAAHREPRSIKHRGWTGGDSFKLGEAAVLMHRSIAGVTLHFLSAV